MTSSKRPIINKNRLDRLYETYTNRDWVHPDPIEFLYRYTDRKDIEIAGLIASSLAYGRVAQILKSVSSVLEKMGPSPFCYLQRATPASLEKSFHGFKHRFTTHEELVEILRGMRDVIERYGSLYDCFLSGFSADDESILPGLSFLVRELSAFFHGHCNSLLPSPERRSACKRLNLFLRWMVRKDLVDPGGWQRIPRTKLLVPLDTHMHRICVLLGLTKRKQADFNTAIEITCAFQHIAPEDPVRYDFALTRLGIRSDLDFRTALGAIMPPGRCSTNL
jgi:uncharacterized protein (TIGR02757 family)